MQPRCRIPPTLEKSGADLTALVQRVQENSNITVFTNATCFGLYEGNLLGIVHKTSVSTVAQLLTQLRTERIVVATGAHEIPLLFENNDLPGVMLSSGALRLIGLHSVKPGDRAVILGNQDFRSADCRSLRRPQALRLSASCLARSGRQSYRSQACIGSPDDRSAVRVRSRRHVRRLGAGRRISRTSRRQR